VVLKDPAGSIPALGTPSMRKQRVITWTPELAYVVGLITTDGSLSKDKRHICYTSTDYSLLVIFKHCIDLNAPIRLNPQGSLSKKKAFRIQFSDVVFYRWLNKIGIHNNKSLTIGSLEIPGAYFTDFLRGHLDGDGSVINYTDRYLIKQNPKYVYDRLFIKFISASRKHMIWMQKTIHHLYSVKGSLHTSVSRSQKGKMPMYILKFSTKEAKRLLNTIYYRSGLPCLKRKYRIAEPYLTGI
jgi:hypothetical protein